MEIDERSSQSQVISQRGPSNVYIEWIGKSVQEGSIHCYSEGDIKVGRTPIATGAYGVVFKATMKRTGMPVAMKTLVRRPGECDEKLYKKFVKEERLFVNFSCLVSYALCYRFIANNLHTIGMRS